MSGRTIASPPLPIAPLLAYLPTNDEAAAAAVGVSLTTIRRWRSGKTATITRYEADRVTCHRLGINPATVWFHDWW